MHLKIPKTFQLGGRTWKVKRVGKKRWYGRCIAGRCQIEIAECRSKEEELHTFLHELTHAIMYTMGRKKLFSDEYFVDSSSSLLLQALKSAE